MRLHKHPQVFKNLDCCTCPILIPRPHALKGGEKEILPILTTLCPHRIRWAANDDICSHSTSFTTWT